MITTISWSCSTAQRPTLNSQFTGKEPDAETGLDFFGSRYMSAAQVRWITPDRINLTSIRLVNPTNTLNKYIYGGNNPLKYVDRDGKDITIFYRPPSNDYGHIMLGVFNQSTFQVGFLDYYPKNGTDRLGTGEGAFNLGNMQERAAQAAAGAFATLTIQTTPEEAQEVLNQISRMTKEKAPPYSGAFNNCTTVCEDVLHDLGLDFGDVLPSSYWRDVWRRYSKTVQINPLRAVPFAPVPQKTGVEYGNPRDYGVDFTWFLFELYLNQVEQQRQQAELPHQACVTAAGETHCVPF